MTNPTENFSPEINELKLDQEWLGQPNMVWEYAKKKALANKRVSEAKAALKVTIAELSKAIRAEPLEYGLDKVTESTVENTILLQKEHRVDQQALIDAEYNADILGAAVAALQDRRRALEGLVELHGQNYFSDPRPGPHSKEGVEENTKRHARTRARKDDE